MSETDTSRICWTVTNTNRSKPSGLLITVAILALVLAACGNGAGRTAATTRQNFRPTAPPLPHLDPEQLVSGAQVYQASCASCHGANGEGEPDWKTPKRDGVYPAPPHDATGHTWHHGDGLLYQIVRDGGASLDLPGFKSGMPAFRDTLRAAGMRAVLEYLKSHCPEEKRQAQWLAGQNDPLPAPQR